MDKNVKSLLLAARAESEKVEQNQETVLLIVNSLFLEQRLLAFAMPVL